MKYTNLQKTLDSISDEFLQEYKKKLGDSNISKNISIDINNYLRFNGYKSLSEMVLELESTRTNIGYKMDLPAAPFSSAILPAIAVPKLT